MEEKDIIIKAGELFVKYGIKSMTMDDIAREMGVSKKTLYQFVENKKDLVKKVMSLHIHNQQDCICEMHSAEGNAIDKLMEIGAFVNQHMRSLHPSVIFDLKKYHPEAWGYLNKHKEEFIYTTIKSNLEEGMSEGLYREDLKPDLVARLYMGMTNALIDSESFPSDQFSKEELHNEMTKYHIRAVLSKKGIEYIKTKMEKNEK
ncbi:MAG: TetR family transcriptional regulator [Flavobacteriales bacterium]|nr:TetR family transcriptional regulator [Flavobacteriales bacterium]|tara:strand:- start:15088 stop:15696 length:609 start_codon:yes stop_codon:yes gene_type:complete